MSMYYDDGKVINVNHGDYIGIIAKHLNKNIIYMSYSGQFEDLQFEAEYERIRNSIRIEDKEIASAIAESLMLENMSILVCDSYEEMQKYYNQIDGDDTDGCIYALTFRSNGESESENT